jgi:hypothetical protein
VGEAVIASSLPHQTCGYGEMAAALGLGPSVREDVGVRLPLPVPELNNGV